MSSLPFDFSVPADVAVFADNFYCHLGSHENIAITVFSTYYTNACRRYTDAILHTLKLRNYVGVEILYNYLRNNSDRIEIDYKLVERKLKRYGNLALNETVREHHRQLRLRMELNLRALDLLTHSQGYY